MLTAGTMETQSPGGVSRSPAGERVVRNNQVTQCVWPSLKQASHSAEPFPLPSLLVLWPVGSSCTCDGGSQPAFCTILSSIQKALGQRQLLSSLHLQQASLSHWGWFPSLLQSHQLPLSHPKLNWEPARFLLPCPWFINSTNIYLSVSTSPSVRLRSGEPAVEKTPRVPDHRELTL